MRINGYLSEFSLGEVFRFLEQGRKTGCLVIRPFTGYTGFKEYYIFFKRGYVVAASDSDQNRSLECMIEDRQWLRVNTIQRLRSLCANNTCLGVCLKENRALNEEQLKSLFKQQVLTPIPQLFALPDSWFEFKGNHPLPLEEMTGLSASPMDIALVGLRVLKDWRPLFDKLPHPQSTLMSLHSGQPPYHLSRHEWQVWEHIVGHTSIQQISGSLGMEVLEVQKIVFRLMVVGLVEEIESVSGISEDDTQPWNDQEEITPSFLDGLLSFLRSKA
ncbi:MAG: DUF4388 domain-containing protein [Pseudanabaenaceae cyanobacterium]